MTGFHEYDGVTNDKAERLKALNEVTLGATFIHNLCDCQTSMSLDDCILIEFVLST